MSIKSIKESAKKYPGSYHIGVSGRAKLKGVIVTFMAYTNPQNSTGACYIEYRTGGMDYSITSRNLDIYNINDVKAVITNDL